MSEDMRSQGTANIALKNIDDLESLKNVFEEISKKIKESISDCLETVGSVSKQKLTTIIAFIREKVQFLDRLTLKEKLLLMSTSIIYGISNAISTEIVYMIRGLENSVGADLVPVVNELIGIRFISILYFFSSVVITGPLFEILRGSKLTEEYSNTTDLPPDEFGFFDNHQMPS